MKSILIVEDDDDLRELLVYVFESEGFHVFAAVDGSEALDRLADQPPDLVLTDLLMPNVDGATLCRSMRADPRLRSIPIVVMSAFRDTGHLEPNDYEVFLPKPFELDALLGEVARLTDHAGALGRLLATAG